MTEWFGNEAKFLKEPNDDMINNRMGNKTDTPHYQSILKYEKSLKKHMHPKEIPSCE